MNLLFTELPGPCHGLASFACDPVIIIKNASGFSESRNMPGRQILPTACQRSAAKWQRFDADGRIVVAYTGFFVIALLIFDAVTLLSLLP